MVKVGSAGPVIDSVLQAPRNDTNNNGRTQKNRDANIMQKKSTDRVIKDSEVIDAENDRRAKIDAFEKKVTPSVVITPSATVEIGGNILATDGSGELSQEGVQNAVDEINKSIEHVGASVAFSFHEKTGRYSFKVLDNVTGEIIREVPPEKSLDIVAKMLEMAGVLIDEKG